MAIVLDEMDLSPPHSRPTTPNSNVMTEETPCQWLVRTTANIKRFTTTRDGYKQILTSLESDANHDPTNALYVKIQKEYEEISALLENGVAIKSLPKSTHVDEIKSDLEEQGFEPERVVQLIGRKTKILLPVYMISLPRNITNLKIFDIKTLGYLSIRVEPYEGRGITQCFRVTTN
ncbi:hypothetical protein TNCV_1372421 [Trichonephila clavipes]|nr:hypothetical protein TNCV_1372421 [Trichonephila clavipes]